MIVSLKTDQDFIYAYCEFQILNKEAQFKSFGDYIYIQDAWIHPWFQGTGALRDLISAIYDHEFTQKSAWVYWDREKYDFRQTRLFKKERLARMGRKDEAVL